MRIVYSRRYDISFFGLERLHPFDSKKYSRAWALLKREFGAMLTQHHLPVDREVSDAELRLGHTPGYLSSLQSSSVIAAALELPPFRHLPAWLLRWRVLRPMRWGVRGSVIAAKAALEHGLAVNLSGGYHHARPSEGEGFCIFSDIALMVRQLRVENVLASSGHILYVDLDAHQGNGVCHQFEDDNSVCIFDMYNGEIYPRQDSRARRRIDCDLPLPFGCEGARYLRLLRERLPGFLDAKGRAGTATLAIYNAGTDVFMGDALGGLKLTAEEILERDLFVFDELRRRRIPVVMLLSGGYSRESCRLVASTVGSLLRKFGIIEPRRI